MPKPRSNDSLWLRDEERPRRRRLSRDRVVEAAIGLLDSEGVNGFSMRRLAARLNAGTMSLYEYVAAKEDVLDLALDTVLAEVELEESEDASWRDILTTHMTQTRRVMRRHPWVPTLVGSRPLLGPSALARSERFYAALNRAGLSGPLLLAAVGTTFSYVHGYVAAENSWHTWVRDPPQHADAPDRARSHLTQRTSLYPTLAQHAQLEYDDFDGQFHLGLTIVLDGIEAQVER